MGGGRTKPEGETGGCSQLSIDMISDRQQLTLLGQELLRMNNSRTCGTINNRWWSHSELKQDSEMYKLAVSTYNLLPTKSRILTIP